VLKNPIAIRGRGKCTRTWIGKWRNLWKEWQMCSNKGRTKINVLGQKSALTWVNESEGKMKVRRLFISQLIYKARESKVVGWLGTF
jgi:hypothetical protein